MSRKQRVGAAVIVGAVAVLIWFGDSGRGEDRPSAESRERKHFVQIGNKYINLDQIVYADFDEDSIGIHFVSPNQAMGFSGKDEEQLKAVLDGMSVNHVDKVAAAPDVKPAPDPFAAGLKLLAFDDFDGKLGLNWKPVRPDPSHVSLTKNPGKLTITTQRGSIHGDEKNDAFGEGIQAKNLYVIDNPLAADTDFVVTTCVSGFTPETTYQQAGLIVYNDDDNYLKFGYEYNWPNQGGQAFCILTETDAKSEFKYIESEAGLKRYWVRLTKRGSRYEYATSTDGKEFHTHGEVVWGDGLPQRIGLLAKNGGNKEAGELDAAFEFFELRPPAAPGPRPNE